MGGGKEGLLLGSAILPSKSPPSDRWTSDDLIGFLARPPAPLSPDFRHAPFSSHSSFLLLSFLRSATIDGSRPVGGGQMRCQTEETAAAAEQCKCTDQRREVEWANRIKATATAKVDQPLVFIRSLSNCSCSFFRPQPRRRHSLCPLRSLLPNQRPSNSPPTSPPLPTSPAATLLVAGWRRELAKPSSPESGTESSSSHSGCGGGTSLSELSQEVLAQVITCFSETSLCLIRCLIMNWPLVYSFPLPQLIRLFPFPAPSPQSPPQRPKLCRALSQPATSIDYSTPSCSATVDETVVACSSTAIASKVAAERSQCSAETYVTGKRGSRMGDH
jgi:hypothetical protein